MSYKGTVTNTSRKDGVGKNGKPYTLFSGKVDNSDLFLNFKFKDPGISKGDIIEYDGEPSSTGKGFDVTRHRVVGKSEVPAAAASSAAPSGGGGSRDDYWAKKEAYDKENTQPRIQYQNARSHALQFLEILATQDGLPITAATGKANKAKRYDELKEILDKLTVEFFYDTSKLRVLERVADAGDVVITPPTPLPTAAPSEDEEEFPSQDDTGEWQ